MTIALSVEVSSEGARTLVTISGEIDTYTAAKLTEGFAGLGDAAGRHVVVDLSSVGFVDSAGLTALVRGLTEVTDRGGLVSLRSVSRQLAKLFDITGLSGKFPSSTAE